MWDSFKKIWEKLVSAEKRAQDFAVHEAEVIAHEAEEIFHAVENAVDRFEHAAEHLADRADEAIQTAEETAVEKAREFADMARHFIHFEAAGGIMLVAAALVAVLLANSPLYPLYDHILNGLHFRIGFTDSMGSFDHELKKSVLLWINDGFMAVFFFLVGLEIKREFVEGELSHRTRALLPMLAAIGGMAVPAAIFWFINKDNPETIHGWAIPAATDIAFALGVLSLLGSRVPTSLKVLLTAIAIIDDIGAILIIALFYSHEIIITPLYFAAAALVLLGGVSYNKTCSAIPYILLGIVLWMAVLESGIHATLAGVLTALFVPVRDPAHPWRKPCREMEQALHPWVAYGILPVFALANAGVPFAGMGAESFTEPLTLGIILGLVAGKQLGIFTALWLTIKTGLSPKLKDVGWVQLYALSILCGIGFTMSLFIGGLSFDSLELQVSVRLGVLTASVISAVAGFALLYFFSPQTPQPQKSESEDPQKMLS